MAVGKAWSTIAVLVLFTVTWVWCQSTDNPPERSSNVVAAEHFIEPDTINPYVDRFVKDKTEYLFVSKKFRAEYAATHCRERYNAKLAYIRTVPLANFLAEALSETNLVLDSLWTAGQLPVNSTVWQWLNEGANPENLGEEIVNLMQTGNVTANDRNCLAFARMDHDEPQFRPLTCMARRSFMCERARGAPDGDNSTHPGWIRLGSRLFKIFREYVTYDEAALRCYHYDPLSALAVITNYSTSQNLGRYLLIGRPSLENAWIGAKWKDSGEYGFEDEPVFLNNKTDLEGYPPWRNQTMTRPGGCILLDRHLANYTLFVEARCQRLRPYICYKFIRNASYPTNFTDIIFDDMAYRIYFAKKSWPGAKDFCHSFVEKGIKSAKLTEIEADKQIYELLYVMGENRTAAQHIWIGGKFGNDTWSWDSTKKDLDPFVVLVANETYTEDVEAVYTCLNMDRENHLAPLFYGTDCLTPQFFVCQFSPEDLKALEAQEAKVEEPKPEER